jgi:predicted ester cyclase
MATEENKAILRRIYQECFNQGNLATADELVAPNSRDTSPGIPPGVPNTGPDALKGIVSLLRSAFPDLQVTIDEMIAEGDTIVARATFTGTHRGNFQGIQPTGQRVSFGTIDIVQLRDGQCVSHYGLQDGLGLMQQVGGISTAGQATPANAGQATPTRG